MRHAARIAAFAFACSSALALSACGSEEISVAKSDPYLKGAEIFSQRCSGCHSLSVVGAHGSSIKASDKEITDGPDFNQRKETRANVLYALRNGGFSGKIMPQNLVTGDEAEQVAGFLEEYAGRDAKNPAAPARTAAEGDNEEAGTTVPSEDDGGPIAPDTDEPLGSEAEGGVTAP